MDGLLLPLKIFSKMVLFEAMIKKAEVLIFNRKDYVTMGLI
jgi:hypothetical protein